MPATNRELADFLRRARSRVDPARAGLPADGRIRRVPGLRREEVALLAGVSTDYYTRLEQGRRITPTAGVVDAIARALDLDAAGRTHLGDLIGTSAPRKRRSAPVVQRVRPGLHQFLDSLVGQPAFILGRRTDVLASNRLARALLTDFDQLPVKQRNYARWILLSDEARALCRDWEVQARAVVENLRLDIGTDPDDPLARELVADLAAHSCEFRAWWDAHSVYQRTFGSKQFRHPVAGDLTVNYETLTLPGDPDQTLFVYTTEAGTTSREAMDLLASWVWSSPSAHDHRSGRPGTL
ncbi:transcriptional regulator, XRE family [Kribbella flavida DSM 17836]|uniref:Transcriptional regulator, XRE family n=1 Tax=Kribbella flavida (strain DSM 17836 / JCM 10339 / NBRC 14399) TaxID=479435 RepID=D2PQS2_KRIFD|nr:helix-turn-helix transcriptional regulator [Kribbella flavida]ADB31055.1 transcriptional regulator, XRE family [Kribbella flavida DSM 17836]